MKDYYQILQVSPSATIGEIKRAYRILAKKLHPDANDGSAEAEAHFLELVDAYKVLSDRVARSHYDAQKKHEAEEVRRHSWWGKLQRLWQVEDESEADVELVPRYALIMKLTGFFLLVFAAAGTLFGLKMAFDTSLPGNMAGGAWYCTIWGSVAFFVVSLFVLGHSEFVAGLELRRLELMGVTLIVTLALASLLYQNQIPERVLRKVARELGIVVSEKPAMGEKAK